MNAFATFFQTKHRGGSSYLRNNRLKKNTKIRIAAIGFSPDRHKIGVLQGRGITFHAENAEFPPPSTNYGTELQLRTT
jgi:hypothetical protein